jgi:hypothetical protein
VLAALEARQGGAVRDAEASWAAREAVLGRAHVASEAPSASGASETVGEKVGGDSPDEDDGGDGDGAAMAPWARAALAAGAGVVLDARGAPRRGVWPWSAAALRRA